MAVFLTNTEHKPTAFTDSLEVWYDKRKKYEMGDPKVFGLTTLKVEIAFSKIKTVGKRSFERKSLFRLGIL